ncbi:hypothetical protein CHH28_03240 [Bacterioplanes sanyensis]|uniref:Lipoprotein n=1 Tax=Bacterioplanes sanyensis TaxID=1249553 RepID=A0A222FFA1_9GAMM|nr:hypothetical protein [Bacterioplanes sanyensis]ASP37747.1 hypothetical protein CHH28_03240 [Bacterioplanes sanyensis]
MRIFSLVIALLLLGGCTHSVHLHHVSDVEPTLGQQPATTLEASGEQSVVLGFAFDTQYADDARRQLLQQCPGKLTAISTRYSTSHGFLHWTNRIHLTGLCVNPAAE